MFSMSEHVLPFMRTDYVDDEDGYVVWRSGTGGNVELLHLRASTEREGAGTRLLEKMLKRLGTRPPYHSVFGFTRSCNTTAQAFYRKSGFALTPVPGVYADGEAVLFSAPYQTLREIHREKHP